MAFCNELGVEISSNYAKVQYQSGELPGFVVAHAVRFSRADVLTWLRAHRRG